MDHSGDREEAWYDDDAGPVARPYTVTRGRTAPVGRFDLIALVVTRPGAVVPGGLFPEHREILRRCRQPLSVAEVGAALDLPVGAVRVLLGDLVEAGLVETREPSSPGERPSMELLTALLAGLRSL
ncbi:DUF742 domain-containing protein [Micromonospora sp. WMMD558]|uniref:DUF742 domain-containing protein n=1 Tax=unclassified Micromonospora TaxID=2617518 RepID=UPI0012B464BD|nr:DUF742 domain-containing protein [Micromonospora sp. WMMC415]QGN45572.1 DUF742 domain-containing protein [Micromonospora sp. WMMC415]